ncbi:putative secretion system X translation initiation factor [Candidatus Burkholderia verschuerenii]|uniref:Putative secretion system X translation initiation factor n=1 Tax=Candidatus Burkholderia verschuerenii TaxID=242163 RepID=A0A0L0MAW5_9BURK|nr:hypothetical protein [Candidatus Burkholderia verschuerenii]KND59508.1 putative secretion system X translation initiation factor [Candidatus Burkholderia verschuerenii]
MKPLDARSLKVSKPLLLLLIATLGLIVFVHFRSEDDAPADSAAPTEQSAPPQRSATPASAPDSIAGTEQSPVDLFPSQNCQPPPPPPPPGSVKPPPPPEPPPLPFAVRSLWLDQHGVFYILLSGTGREFPLCENCQKKSFLRSGDVILNAYKIEHIDRREVRFMYLPLKRRQTLTLGELK